jgi:hypothetical protein
MRVIYVPARRNPVDQLARRSADVKSRGWPEPLVGKTGIDSR